MADDKPEPTTELARERSRLAADRTLLAWIRTALALIGFGFSVDKVLSYLQTVNPDGKLGRPLGAKVFGAAFVGLGTLSLIAAAIQHWRALRRIAQGELVYVPLWPLTEAVTIALAAIGIYALVSILG